MRRLLALACAPILLAVVATGAPPSALPVQAGGCVVIVKAYYDSPGSDLGSNGSLNDEWVQVRNRCSSRKSADSSCCG